MDNEKIIIRSHLLELEESASFQWFMKAVRDRYEDAVRMALIANPVEDREFLVGRVRGIADMLGLPDVLKRRAED